MHKKCVSQNTIDDCAKDGVEEFFTKILCGIEEINQSNQSKFNATQSIMVKNSCPPSLAQSSIRARKSDLGKIDLG